ncbi:MAG TPA: diaminopimelate epimerase [Planctomycetaceae bacterium]|nr:diaminopimelate epimerase [Planctomycetaceae bacterium]
MRFTKMHGAGNDYVYVDCFQQPPPPNPGALARAVSDRHTGIGADGLILIEPSDVADARMRMWNADGTAGEMCGNGIRCVAKYLYERNLARKDVQTIDTGGGVKTLWPAVVNGRVEHVRVNMGRPILEAARIPTTLPGDPPVLAALDLADRRMSVTCVSMGNPHCVLFVEELTDHWVLSMGPVIEQHPAFPARINVEFVQVQSRSELAIRVWERGAGETLACGTGACAAAVAAVLAGRTGRTVACRLRGGTLEVDWSETGDVILTGPAVEVFEGDWPDG